ncbi:MAG TPA: EAL domain-containing protein [Epulopiscium sp.]|nr:EAL domain-containing protein [Candidatus Epulonipiscium sp.]
MVNLKKEQNAHADALKTAFYCGAIGIAGVSILDVSFNKLVTSLDSYIKFEKYKAWFYALITIGVVYILVKNKIKQITQATCVSIKEQKTMEEKLYSLAYYDVLTGLPNRSKFESKVNQKINQYRDTFYQFAIVYMNADNFRRINDTWGYEVGDELLKYISSIFSRHSEKFFVCSHLGGDEFAIVIDQTNSRCEIENKLEKFLEVFEEPWEYKKQKIFITFSAGIVMFPQDGKNLYTLLANADTAMWHVKKHGKDGYGFYTTDIQTKRVSYIQTAHQIRKALKNNEFTMYYQPQINLQTGQLIGMEALIRWDHPERGIISPMEFIPLAETTGEIYAIEKFVLESVCKQKNLWREKGYYPTVVAINISGITLTRGGLAKEIQNLLKTYQIDGSGIKVEVTETAIMTDMDMAVSTLDAIRKLGVQVALDDFGTGYSSLTYLQRLPIDIVKIDREFIKNIKNEGDMEIIVQVVVQIAEALNLEVIAEGVETKEQLRYLQKSRCSQAQGYLFSKPVPAEQMSEIFEAKISYEVGVV